MTKYNKKKLGVSLTMVLGYLSAITIAGNCVAVNYSELITQNLGQKNYVIDSKDNSSSDGNVEDDPYDFDHEEIEDTDYYKADYASPTELIAAEKEYSKEAHGEGIVLLQNKNLPLASGQRITMFGKNSNKVYFACGKASSGYAPSDKAPDVLKTFEDAGFSVNKSMHDFYSNDSFASEVNISDIPTSITNTIADYNDVGIVFIGRGKGEGTDLTYEESKINDAEKSLIEASMSRCKKTVVLLNTANPIDCSYFLDKDVSVVLVGTPGEIGASIIPDVLTGKINPSGHLVDTYVHDTNNAPASYSWGDIRWENAIDKYSSGYVNYVEGIYSGYRYYETRYADTIANREHVGSFDYSSEVVYPFGYGLSYTTFDYSNFQVSRKGNEFEVKVDVENTGAVSGKDAVEIYMRAPYTAYDIQNGVEKSAVRLVGFAKTGEIPAKGKTTVTLTVDAEEMKSYDSKGAKTYIVDDGDYDFAIGQNAHDALNNILSKDGKTTANGMTANGKADLVYTYHQDSFDKTTYAKAVNGTEITNQLDMANLSTYYSDVTYLSRNDWEGTFPKERNKVLNPTAALIQASKPTFEEDNRPMPTTGASNNQSLVSYRGVDYDDKSWNELLDQITPEEMMKEYAMAGFHNLGIDSIQKPMAIDNDGPNKLVASYSDGQDTHGFPTQNVLAQTWNKELIGKEGYFAAQDGILAGLTGWYAPGMNIHRTNLCGRNADYFSEDPFISGVAASAITLQAEEHGLVCYTKHFALNDQETNRSGYATFANEQTIREIYLKPFEMSVTDGKATGIMTSMNYVGPQYASANPKLLTNIVRKEWNFHGVIITDATGNPNGGKTNQRDVLLAGTDLILISGGRTSWFIDGYQNDAAVMNALRDAMHHVLYAYANSNIMNGLSMNTHYRTVLAPWQIGLISFDVVFGVIAIGGIFCIIKFLFLEGKKNKGGEK